MTQLCIKVCNVKPLETNTEQSSPIVCHTPNWSSVELNEHTTSIPKKSKRSFTICTQRGTGKFQWTDKPPFVQAPISTKNHNLKPLDMGETVNIALTICEHPLNVVNTSHGMPGYHSDLLAAQLKNRTLTTTLFGSKRTRLNRKIHNFLILEFMDISLDL